jgi:hypothetical protein
LSEFKGTAQASDVDTTKASASLPGLDVEVVHRRSPQGDAEQISITLRAMPSFEALGSWLEAANPFVFWTRAAQLAWLPWLEAARIASEPARLSGLGKPDASR